MNETHKSTVIAANPTVVSEVSSTSAEQPDDISVGAQTATNTSTKNELSVRKISRFNVDEAEAGVSGCNHNNSNSICINKAIKDKLCDVDFDRLVIDTSHTVVQKNLSGLGEPELHSQRSRGGLKAQKRVNLKREPLKGGKLLPVRDGTANADIDEHSSEDEEIKCSALTAKLAFDSNSQQQAAVNQVDGDPDGSSKSQFDTTGSANQQLVDLNRLNQPKRPMNAFMVWGQAIRRELHNRFSNVQNALLSKALGRVWRSLDPAEKEPFIKRANVIKANHKRDFPDYRYQPRRIQERKAKSNNILIGISLDHNHINMVPQQVNQPQLADVSSPSVSNSNATSAIVSLTSTSISTSAAAIAATTTTTTTANTSAPSSSTITTATATTTTPKTPTAAAARLDLDQNALMATDNANHPSRNFLYNHNHHNNHHVHHQHQGLSSPSTSSSSTPLVINVQSELQQGSDNSSASANIGASIGDTNNQLIHNIVQRPAVLRAGAGNNDSLRFAESNSCRLDHFNINISSNDELSESSNPNSIQQALGEIDCQNAYYVTTSSSSASSATTTAPAHQQFSNSLNEAGRDLMLMNIGGAIRCNNSINDATYHDPRQHHLQYQDQVNHQHIASILSGPMTNKQRESELQFGYLNGHQHQQHSPSYHQHPPPHNHHQHHHDHEHLNQEHFTYNTALHQQQQHHHHQQQQQQHHPTYQQQIGSYGAIGTLAMPSVATLTTGQFESSVESNNHGISQGNIYATSINHAASNLLYNRTYSANKGRNPLEMSLNQSIRTNEISATGDEVQFGHYHQSGIV